MKKKFCLVIVTYPGKLLQTKKLINDNRTFKFVIFLNNFKKNTLLKMQINVFISTRVLPVAELK